MKTVFFCPDCGYIGAAEDEEDHLCPKCSQHILYSTGMDRDAYLALSPEEKNAAVSLWKYECSQPHGRIRSDAAKPGENGVARMLKVIGILVYILCGIAGIAALTSGSYSASLIVLGSGFASGTLFLGFSEIIRLLDVISKK